MQRFREIHSDAEPVRKTGGFRLAAVDALLSELETNGLVVLPAIVGADQLQEMQAAFEARLRHLRWNNCDGYQRTETYRLMVEDVLLDRKSTRLNSSHSQISYAVFCLKKKN